MAWTARDDDDKREYFDSPEELDKKVTQVASWIKASKHMIVFTVSLCMLQLLNKCLICVLPFCREQELALLLEVSFLKYHASLHVHRTLKLKSQIDALS
jgi:hypothetical protein